MDRLGKLVADAVIGVDTLWGGDVLCASGTGRFIADSWFSDEELPAAYTCSAAARIRQAGGVTSKELERAIVEEYVKQIDIVGAAKEIRQEAEKIRGLRGSYLMGLATCVEVMWDLAMEVFGKGEPVSYAQVRGSLYGACAGEVEAADETRTSGRVVETRGLLDRRRNGNSEGRGCMESRAAGSDGIGTGAGKRGHRALRQTVRKESGAVICRRNLRACREPTLIFCRSRMRGFRGR